MAVHMLIVLRWQRPSHPHPPAPPCRFLRFLVLTHNRGEQNHYYKCLGTIMPQNQPTMLINHYHKLLNQYVLEQGQSTKLNTNPIIFWKQKNVFIWDLELLRFILCSFYIRNTVLNIFLNEKDIYIFHYIYVNNIVWTRNAMISL